MDPCFLCDQSTSALGLSVCLQILRYRSVTLRHSKIARCLAVLPRFAVFYCCRFSCFQCFTWICSLHTQSLVSKWCGGEMQTGCSPQTSSVQTGAEYRRGPRALPGQIYQCLPFLQQTVWLVVVTKAYTTLFDLALLNRPLLLLMLIIKIVFSLQLYLPFSMCLWIFSLGHSTLCDSQWNSEVTE